MLALLSPTITKHILNTLVKAISALGDFLKFKNLKYLKQLLS